jgi:sugar/nucleoside kinase (ribokinase family)
MNGDGSLLCVGLTTVDIVAAPVALEAFEGTRLIRTLAMAPAGTAAGAAMVAARLGAPTRLFGGVGDDATGRFALAELAHEGVDVSLVTVMEGVGTSATLLPIDKHGVRPVLHAPGAGRLFEMTDAALEAAGQASVVHYAAIGARRLDGGPGEALLAKAKAAGAMTTCDLIGPGPTAAAEVRRLLPHVDVFLPSAVEARFLTGEDDLERAAAIFRDWGAGACVVKNGEHGAIALDATGSLSHVSAFPVERVVDTTSCGDSFCAGFIVATLLGRRWGAALDFGAATASLVAQGPATLGALESRAQVEAILAHRQSR